MMTAVTILDEPRLEFGHGQSLTEPHDGLTAFGPWDDGHSTQPKAINYAVVGTSEGLNRYLSFSKRLRGPIPSSSPKPHLWPMYPGFEAVFNSRWPESPGWSASIDADKLLSAASLADPNRRVFDVVDLYLNAMAPMAQRDEVFSLVVCVVPDYVYKNCRPQSVVRGATGDPITEVQLRERRAGQLDLFETWKAEVYDFSRDFRNQIKARAMQFGMPIQIVLESTLQVGAPESRREALLTPLADRAWNLSTTAYYKAGGKPWRLTVARKGVCYVGLAYRLRDAQPGSRSACCAAQMFLDSGDGIVFLGETGAWYSPERRQFHLDPGAANRLLQGLLQTYERQHGQPLTEIFLHSNSGIDETEFAGFLAACPPGVKLVGVRVRRDYGGALKLYRPGAWPVVRGTVWQLTDRTGYLWGSGFSARLRTYPGAETPVPLRIEIQRGEADFSQVAADIFSLTKLNYNACKLGDGEPVTIGFSKEVGEILVTNPTIREARPQFRFYI